MLWSFKVLNKPFVVLDRRDTILKIKVCRRAVCLSFSISQSKNSNEIHRAYIGSPGQIVYTNTFGANRYKLQSSGYTVEE